MRQLYGLSLEVVYVELYMAGSHFKIAFQRQKVVPVQIAERRREAHSFMFSHPA